MAEKIVLETEIKTGNSATSVKSVKQELRSLQAEMANLEVGSTAFTTAARRAGDLKDKIDDAALGVKAFNPEAKFTAFAGVLGGVANGFSVVQGAMSLMGGESKEVEKMILKTQAAIAIATGVNGLLGMKDAFIVLSTVIKTQVVAAFATMRSAIIATGILGLVVLIGTLVYQWMEEKKANEEATKELERFGEAQRKLLDQEQKIQIEREKGRKKEILQASAETQAKIREYQKELDEKILTQEEFSKLLAGEQELMRIKVANINKTYDEEEQKQKEAEAEKRIALAEKEAKRLKEIKDKEIANKKSNDEYAKLADATFTKEMYAQIDAQVAANKFMNDTIAQWDRQGFEDSMKQYDAIQAANKAAMETDEAKKNAQLNNLAQVNQALNGFASLVGQQTIAGKALAIATTTIDTYVASFRAYKEGLKLDPTGTFSIIAAAAAAATGIASIRKIVSVQVPGGGGGSMPSAPASVPQFNPAVAQQVQGGGDVQLGMKPQKVYVVESDIRGSMNKVDVIQSNAKIG